MRVEGTGQTEPPERPGPPGPPVGARLSDATIAGRLALAWSVVILAAGLLLLVLVPLTSRANERGGYCESPDHPSPCPSLAASFVPGVTALALGGWHLAASIGLLRGRSWARWGVIVTFSLWAIGMVVAVVEAVIVPEDDADAGGFVTLLLMLGYFVAIVVLAYGRSQRRSPVG